jgi:hypothetical protein
LTRSVRILHLALSYALRQKWQVPFFEIDSVLALNPTNDSSTNEKEANCDKSSGRSRLKSTNTVEIRTDVDGHNSGRVYFFRAECGDECRRIEEHLRVLSKAARRRFQLRTVWERAQDQIKSAYDSALVQALVGALILSVCMPF